MGCFSWCDCKNKSKNIKMGEKAYVLVPKEFSDRFGAVIAESCYDGYGHFGSYDMYELVAIWNEKYISADNLRPAPKLEQYGGLWYGEREELKKQGLSDDKIKALDEEKQRLNYERAMRGYETKIRRIDDFKAGVSTEKMCEKYGDDWLRCLGIDIACYDEQNAALKYPIKITHDSTAVYEKCRNVLVYIRKI